MKTETQQSIEFFNESKYMNPEWPDVFKNDIPILKTSEDSFKWIMKNQKIIVRNISWNIFHLLVIGTEECERSIAASTINTSKKLWENYLIQLLGPSYIPLRSHTLQAIHMICFAHKSIAHLITDISSSAIATGTNE